MTAIKTGAQPLRQRLAPRLIGLVMLTALVTGGLLGLMLIQSSRSIMREEILAKNLATADLVAKFAANYIEGAQTNVRQFAARPLFIRAVLERDLTTAETHLAQFLEINPRFDIISVYDAQGFGWASGMKGNWPNRGGSVADRDYFQGNMESKAPYLGIPVYSRSTGNAVIPYSVPIFDDRGEINAIVSGGLLLEALSEAAAGLGANSFARASLLDARQNGIIVTHSDPQRLLTPVTGQNAASLHALAGERGTMETPDSRGDLSLAAFSPVPGLPWAALIMEPVETAFAPLNRLTVKAGFCLGAVILIATALGIWFVRKITRPVQELIEGTEAISQGNLDHVIPVRGRDEIGRLADAFNAMTTSLKLSRGENARLLQETRQSEERLRYLISSCPVAIYTTRSGGDYGATFITPNVVALVGYEPHEFTADPGFWADHLHPEDAPRVFAALSRLHVDGHHADEYRFLCKDGTYRWMRDEAVLINDEQGVARELVGSWIDITERKRMEEALREERDKLEERVFERTQVLQESERRLALLGRLREELIGAADLSAKLKRITDGIVEIFDADLARVWVTGEADRCDEGCCHAAVSEGSAACRDRSRCLHLVASSGRYTDLDGDHGRVPLGC